MTFNHKKHRKFIFIQSFRGSEHGLGAEEMCFCHSLVELTLGRKRNPSYVQVYSTKGADATSEAVGKSVCVHLQAEVRN